MPMPLANAFDLIEGAHERGRLAHAFLITGPVGRETEELAARVAHLLNGEHGNDPTVDIFEGEGAPNNLTLAEMEGPWTRVVRPASKSRRIRVAEIRELEKMMHQSAPKSKWKIGVVVDADRMNEQAENAFLKTLEEPPPQSLLLLLSSEPERLLPTIWSRCVHLALQGPKALELSGFQEKLVTVLARTTERGWGKVESGLVVKAALDPLLADRKKEIAKGYEVALKEDIKTYRDGSDGTWLSGQKDIYEAKTSADYLQERTRVVELMLHWFGDLLRLAGGMPAERLAFPAQREVMAAVASGESVVSLTRRIAALEELRSLLETNVTEALAFEVCLLEAFGPGAVG